eukprot:scaffold3573_cov23-Tisochrysis_lutea.AAC.2
MPSSEARRRHAVERGALDRQLRTCACSGRGKGRAALALKTGGRRRQLRWQEEWRQQRCVRRAG